MSLSIYDFEDYRDYLRAWFEEKKARSVRALAQKIGVSASTVSMICKGSRNLKLEHAEHWATSGLLLDKDETDHWSAMVRREHGATERDREVALRQIRAAQAWQNAVSQTRMLRAFDNWYGGVVKEMAKLPGFEATGAWIAPRLLPPADPVEVQETLDLLFSEGQLVRCDDGSIEVGGNRTTALQISDAAIAAATVRVHKSWLNRGLVAVEKPVDGARFTSSVLAIDPQRLQELVAVVHRRHIETAETAAAHEPTTVVEVALVIAPRSKWDDR